MKTISQNEMNNILDNLTEPIQESLKEQKSDILSPFADLMYNPQSTTGARHWYYLDNKIYNKTTEAERATASEFIIGGMNKK